MIFVAESVPKSDNTVWGACSKKCGRGIIKAYRNRAVVNTLPCALHDCREYYFILLETKHLQTMGQKQNSRPYYRDFLRCVSEIKVDISI